MAINESSWRAFFWGRHGILLTCLMCLLLFQPLVETKVGGYIVEGLFVLVLLSSLKAIGVEKLVLNSEILLLLIALLCTLSAGVTGNERLFILGIICNALFLTIVVVVILRHLLHVDKVTADNLAGAICVYLLLAIIWTYFFLILEFLSPESFSFTQGDQRLELWLSKEFHPFLYFSLVTITTVGYGDMAPISTFARSLSTMEALVGQIYLTVLVAGLVGMYLTSKEADQD